MSDKKEFIEALMDPDNWKPNLSQIAEQTGKTISTVSEQYKVRKNKGLIKLTIESVSEADALKIQKGDVDE